jgi:hypothetical protein
MPSRRSSTLLEAMMPMYEMDEFALEERPKSAIAYQHLPYLVLKVEYSKFIGTPSSKVLKCPTQVHPNKDGFFGHFFLGSHLSICYQNLEKN